MCKKFTQTSDYVHDSVPYCKLVWHIQYSHSKLCLAIVLMYCIRILYTIFSIYDEGYCMLE